MEISNENSSKLDISIYNDLVSPTMKQIGLSAESLLKFVALPFKFLGITAEQLEKKYTKFIEGAINRVPEEKLTTPKGNLVAPILDYAKFSFIDEPGNDLLQEMFSKLLSSSINQDYSSMLHKSFVEVMRFLSGCEAKILQWCFDEIESGKGIFGSGDFYHFGVITTFIAWDDGKKIFEIPATTPGIFPYLNFPVEETLDLLSSLGLIKYRQHHEDGYTFFKNLIDLKKKGMKIPSTFDDVIVKASNVRIYGDSKIYSDTYLLFLLESELPQLCSMLSQCKKISSDKLLNLSVIRNDVAITTYGSQFLSLCIK